MINLKDFARARKALIEADVNFRNTYCYGPNGSFYMNEGKYVPRMPLQALTVKD